MNILKRLNYIILALGFVVFTACEDDFNQDDLLELQQTQLDAAIASLNNSGQFASAIVQVVTWGGDPVSGATVTLLTAGDSTSGGGAQTATTDASGVATFSSVVAGGNWFSVTSADHIGVSGTADIGSINYEVLNGNVVPIKVTGSAIIALYPATGTDLATINGHVLIQTDVTTAAREAAAGVEVKAALNPSAGIDDNGGGGNLEGAGNFNIETLNFFQDETGIGTATTDSLGYYTMQVPAPANSEVGYELVYPQIERDQIIAITSRNGVYLGGIQIDTVATTFGPDSRGDNGGHSAIAAYNGFNITISEPPVAGRGLGLTFTRENRSWTLGTVNAITAMDPAIRTGGGQYVFEMTNLGAGYTESPTVTVTDATGTDQRVEAHIQFAVTALTASGTLTGKGATVNFTGEYVERGFDLTTGATDTTNATETAGFAGVFALTVNSNGAGEITQDSVNVAVQAAIANDDDYFDPDNLDDLDDFAQDIKLVDGAGAILRVTSAVGRVQALQSTTLTGTSFSGNYTAPSIAFSGGGGTTQASATMSQFEAVYRVVTDNSNNTSGYLLLPADMTYEYTNAVAGASQADPVLANGANAWDVIDDPDGNTLIVNGGSFTQAFEIQSSDSTVIARSGQNVVIEASFTSVSTPTAVIVERLEECAQWPIGVDADITKSGQIDDLTLSTSYGLTTLNNNVEVAVIRGSGYISAPTITITAVSGLPGSGATFYIGGDYQNDGEFVIDPSTLTVLNPGSGYLDQANAITLGEGAYSGPFGDTFVNVSSGDVINVTYDYNTGNRSEAVY